MNIASIVHEPKSNLSYAFDKETLHIRIKTQKDEINRIVLRAADPFDWVPSKEDPNKYVFDIDSMKNFEMKKEYTTRTHDVWFTEVKGFTWLRIRYAFLIECKNQKYIYGCNNVDDLTKYPSKRDNIWNYFNFPYINEEDIYKAPDWVKDTIWYQIPVGCYSNDGEQCETNVSGNFKGMIKKLDYIQDMGYTGIYFTPIFKASSWHKYDTTDYMEVDSAYGDKKTFKKFIDEAHKRGIKVILDAVFNHCGYQHPFWLDVMKYGKKSKYYNCFYILNENKPIVQNMHEDGTFEECSRDELNFRTFAYTQFMPKWNTGNPIVREYLLNVAKYWIEFGIDGWRLDVSNEVSHDFWREFRKVVKGVNPQAYIVGENWDYSYPWLQGDQFDAVMNYGFMNPVWNFLGSNNSRISKCNATGFKEEINELLVEYPKHLIKNMYNLVTSHDVDRLMTICNNNPNIVKLAYLLLLTFTGSPSVYYGDEVGISGDVEHNRVPMIWDESKQNLDLKSHIAKLIKLRKSHSSFRAVDMEWLLTDNNTNTIIFTKEENGDQIFVIMHNSDKEETISLPKIMKDKTFKELYRQKDIVLENSLSLNPYEFYILSNC